MSDYWFKRKKNVIGAGPATWQGWMVILAYALANFALVYLFIVTPMLDDVEPSTLQYIIWIALVGVASWILIMVCRAKTDGERLNP